MAHAASHTDGSDDIQTATSLLKGLLSAADWTLFASKLSSISGIAAGGDLSGTYPNPAILNSAVLAKVLTGLNVTGSTIAATDNLLEAFGKLQNQLNGVLGGAIYQGVWNATTNSPTLVSSTGTKGYYYVVSVAGSTNLNGTTDWKVGDWAIFNGTIWQKVDNTDAVSSVNGFIGAVNLTTADISEVTNLYFTAARVLATVLTGFTSGAGTVASTDTILQAIQKLDGNTALKKSTATGNNYKFETTDASGNLQETTVTASKAVVTDANGLPSASATTAAEIALLSDGWIDYSGTSTIVGWGSFVNKQIWYKQIARKAYLVNVFISGTSDNTATSITLPFTNTSNFSVQTISNGSNNGTVGVKLYILDSGANTLTVSNSATAAGVAWTASGTKAIRLSFFAQID